MSTYDKILNLIDNERHICINENDYGGILDIIWKNNYSCELIINVENLSRGRYAVVKTAYGKSTIWLSKKIPNNHLKIFDFFHADPTSSDCEGWSNIMNFDSLDDNVSEKETPVVHIEEVTNSSSKKIFSAPCDFIYSKENDNSVVLRAPKVKTDGSIEENVLAVIKVLKELADKDVVFEDSILIMTKVKDSDEHTFSILGTSLADLKKGTEIIMESGDVRLVVKEEGQ